VLSVPHRTRIHVATAPVDFRRGIDGLCGVVANELDGDPLRHVWVFHNRRRNALKLLFFDHGGYVLVYKRLARGRFRVPKSRGRKALRMTSAELAALLEGIDLSRARRLPRWNPPEAK